MGGGGGGGGGMGRGWRESVRQGGVKKHQTIDAGLISLLCLHYMCTGHTPLAPTTDRQPIRTGL